MSFEIPPNENRELKLSEVSGNDLEILKQLADRLKPVHERIIVFNKTKTCRVRITTTNRNIYVEVTNEEKDIYHFALETQTNQTTE
jgi:hypothetical protein